MSPRLTDRRRLGLLPRVSILVVLMLVALAFVPQESHAFFGKISKFARIARRIPGVGNKIGKVTRLASRIPGVGGKLGAIKGIVGAASRGDIGGALRGATSMVPGPLGKKLGVVSGIAGRFMGGGGAPAESSEEEPQPDQGGGGEAAPEQAPAPSRPAVNRAVRAAQRPIAASAGVGFAPQQTQPPAFAAAPQAQAGPAFGFGAAPGFPQPQFGGFPAPQPQFGGFPGQPPQQAMFGGGGAFPGFPQQPQPFGQGIPTMPNFGPVQFRGVAGPQATFGMIPNAPMVGGGCYCPCAAAPQPPPPPPSCGCPRRRPRYNRRTVEEEDDDVSPEIVTGGRVPSRVLQVVRAIQAGEIGGRRGVGNRSRGTSGHRRGRGSARGRARAQGHRRGGRRAGRRS